MGKVSPEQVRAEQAFQRRIVLEGQLKQQERLDRLVYPLLRNAVPLCGTRVTRRSGIRFANAPLFQHEVVAARSLGFTDTLSVVGVSPGSGAERAGLLPSDRIVALNGKGVPIGRRAAQKFGSALADLARRGLPSARITVRRDGITRLFEIPLDSVCGFAVQWTRSEILNAWADGRTITVTSAMMRFAREDHELAAVLAHEIAHNSMGHIEAMMRNALLGSLVGAVVDVAAAAGGVNTQGEFTKKGAELGAMVFSQEFEREADYVGLYILAMDNRPLAGAATYWRHIAEEDPGSIRFARSHPTSAERFVRMEKWVSEIENKRALGLALRPEMKEPARGKSQPSLAAAFGDVQPTAFADTVQPRAVAAEISTLPSVPPPTAPLVKREVPISPPTHSVERLSDSRSLVKNSSIEESRARQSFEAGTAWMDLHRWETAEASLREAVRLDGSVPGYHAVLGEFLASMGRWSEAEAAFVVAVRLDPRNFTFRERLLEAKSMADRNRP